MLKESLPLIFLLFYLKFSNSEKIEHCITQIAKDNICTECESGYYFSAGGECKLLCEFDYSSAAEAPKYDLNCYVYNDNSCQICYENYYYDQKEKVCKAFDETHQKTINQCDVYFLDNEGTLRCNYCKTGTYPSNAKDSCLQVSTIRKGCKYYNDPNTCDICESDYFINTEDGTCIQNSVFQAKKHPNCFDGRIRDDTDGCSLCSTPYYIEGHYGICIAIPPFIPNCKAHFEDSEAKIAKKLKCQACQEKYEISKDSFSCIENSSSSSTYVFISLLNIISLFLFFQ